MSLQIVDRSIFVEFFLPADCGPPLVPVNGIVLAYTRTTVGHKITYRCNQGYSMSGQSVASCLVSGFWNILPPICIESGEYLRWNGYTLKEHSSIKMFLPPLSVEIYSKKKEFSSQGGNSLTFIRGRKINRKS